MYSVCLSRIIECHESKRKNSNVSWRQVLFSSNTVNIKIVNSKWYKTQAAQFITIRVSICQKPGEPGEHCSVTLAGTIEDTKWEYQYGASYWRKDPTEHYVHNIIMLRIIDETCIRHTRKRRTFTGKWEDRKTNLKYHQKVQQNNVFMIIQNFFH